MRIGRGIRSHIGAEALLVQKYLLNSTKIQILTGKRVCRTKQFMPDGNSAEECKANELAELAGGFTSTKVLAC